MSHRKIIPDEDLRRADDTEMHAHFECIDGYWPVVLEEAKRILSYDDVEIESDSFTENVLAALAARSSEGAMQAVADALGVDVAALNMEVAIWHEARSAGWDLPPPIGFDGLEAAIRKSPYQRSKIAVKRPILQRIWHRLTQQR